MDEFELFADEFLQEQVPRNIVLVGSAKIDDLLRTILEKILRPKCTNSKDTDELLEGDSPLSTFSSRIKMVYRLGLVDKQFYNLLNHVRKIRNLSAHALDFKIKKDPLRSHFVTLRNQVCDRISYKVILERYSESIEIETIDEIKYQFLTICIILELVRKQVGPLPENENTVQISMR
jgi:hypothetical protein